MKDYKTTIVTAISYFFIVLFCYAAISKILDFENFQVQIGQSPLLTAYAGVISYAIISIELVIAAILTIPSTRLYGLFASTALMSAFTVYIYLILNYSEFVPCSCGGILEKMDWTEHLIFNIFCVAIGSAAIYLETVVRNFNSKKSIYVLILSNLLSIALVIFLFIRSEHIIKEENNFTRRFFPNGLIEQQKIELDNDFYYFAGQDQTKIFLGNITRPLEAKILSENLSSSKDFKIQLDTYVHLYKNLRLQIKSPYYYLHDGSVPVIFRGKINNPASRTISYKDAYFDQFAVVDSTKFIFRTISGKTKAFTLGVLDLNAEKKVRLHPEILKKQLDGIFDSDGLLNSETDRGRLIYTYTYRNQLIVMRQNLNDHFIQNTIDTTSVAKIKTTTLSDGRSKMSAPSYRVNKLQTIYKKHLFNNSNLMGKNESRKKWKSASIIDIYNIENHTYIGSVYIPDRNYKKLSGLMVTEDHLYAIVGTEIICYSFRDSLLKALQ
ncbi:MauE/DoxX family redox-associated membrane protein [Chryseobacterium chendengshani]|uniref:MauE/DoxX family redox-associated membrane protein n=1 Tax=Chryseobacterium sp. LJ756 TaxID=2864113 RepID=UPI001C64067C|nr:MauE/DoxX family redox-associated membrane protein [Chryseobacterium sp. LJ756]MBW7674231.1 tellurium resistance protein TerC [Chryseobacterium sp. LJ756]